MGNGELEIEASVTHLLRVRLSLERVVQGVGFCPSIYRLAVEFGLKGWVGNSAEGVIVDVEGPTDAVERFILELPNRLPRMARLDRTRRSELGPSGFRQFVIRNSESDSNKTALVLPDIATCPDCLNELMDPSDRRYLYPFTNCTNCGPRYSILVSLPYDRANTTMARFRMCPRCRAEFEDPKDRRFHAQPNACPECGPQLSLLDSLGNNIASGQWAVAEAASALRRGELLALKGLGGFQLFVDARFSEPVARLRIRKHRPDKPFAVMLPSLSAVETLCHVSELEREILTSPQAPIVLLQRRRTARDGEHSIADPVAPNNPYLGVMLPYTPLHHILMREFDIPSVATSGNISEEPMLTDEADALKRLKGIADLFLVHDRPIACAVDDSVVRVMAEREIVLRRARGFAPLPISLGYKSPPILALGGHLKSVAAATVGTQVMVGAHVGDLESTAARKAFNRSVEGLLSLYEAQPVAVAHDRHPDYHTTKIAHEWETRTVPIQHHLAHIASCMAENGVDGPVLGVAWDGSGYGEDGTIWGGSSSESTVIRLGALLICGLSHFQVEIRQ